MIDKDSLVNMITGAGSFMLVFSVLGEIIISGGTANNNWEQQYDALFPGKYGAYWQLSIGITVMGFFALLCFVIYIVFSIIELSFIPGFINKIIALVGVAFWFGMFIAECCAINWQGPAVATPTRKALANSEMAKIIAEKDPGEYEYVKIYYFDGKNHQEEFPLSPITCFKNPEFNATEYYDEYFCGTVKSPCIRMKSNNKEICLGGWSSKKMESYLKKSAKMNFNRISAMEHIIKYDTYKKFYNNLISEAKKEMLYSLDQGAEDPDNINGIIFATFTSIFLGGQIVGLVFSICSIVLEFIGGSNPKKEDSNSE